MTTIKRLFYRITGGRPMTYIAPMFRDYVTGDQVSLWRDGLGRYWMATSSLALFRIKHDGQHK